MLTVKFSPSSVVSVKEFPTTTTPLKVSFAKSSICAIELPSPLSITFNGSKKVGTKSPTSMNAFYLALIDPLKIASTVEIQEFSARNPFIVLDKDVNGNVTGVEFIIKATVKYTYKNNVLAFY